MRMRTAPVVLVLAALAVAQEDPYYATVKGDRLRVRGGPADYHAILGQLTAGSPVRVLETQADWHRVEVPGGIPVYVSLGQEGRPYLEEPAPGEGVVRVNDLMVRGTPATEFPPIGRLNIGDRVVLLDKEEGWGRIISPEGTNAWVYGPFVERAPDQGAARQEFEERHGVARRALLESGTLSTQMATRVAAEVALSQRVQDAFLAYEGERQKPWDARDIGTVRTSLTTLRDELPAGHRDRVKAETMLANLDEWEKASLALAEVKRRFEETSKEAEEAERRYAATLRDLRKQAEERRNTPPAAEPSPYKYRGRVSRLLPIPGIVSGPAYGLASGGTTLYKLTSDRYQLSDFEGKLVGIREATESSTIPGSTEKILKVIRMEILDG